jgi:hypothetical protein
MSTTGKARERYKKVRQHPPQSPSGYRLPGPVRIIELLNHISFLTWTLLSHGSCQAFPNITTLVLKRLPLAQ